jgi:hypothetical protein
MASDEIVGVGGGEGTVVDVGAVVPPDPAGAPEPAGDPAVFPGGGAVGCATGT